MAVYLKSLAQSSPPAAATLGRPDRREQPADAASARPSTTRTARAATARQGEGKPPHYPPLAGNQSIQMESAVNPIRMVLNGGYPPGTAGNPMPYGMPPFAQIAVRRRGRRRRHLYPHRLGQSRRAGHRRARPTSCARRRWTEARHDQFRPADRREAPTDAGRGRARSSRAGPAARSRSPASRPRSSSRSGSPSISSCSCRADAP